MSERLKILKNAGIVGALTMLSRLTGLIRDAVLASKLGASGLADTFLVAFEIPNLVRRVVGEGALSAFIVPLLTARRERGGPREGWRFLNVVANFMLVVALALALTGMYFSREVYMVFGGGGQWTRTPQGAAFIERIAGYAPDIAAAMSKHGKAGKPPLQRDDVENYDALLALLTGGAEPALTARVLDAAATDTLALNALTIGEWPTDERLASEQAVLAALNVVARADRQATSAAELAAERELDTLGSRADPAAREAIVQAAMEAHRPPGGYHTHDTMFLAHPDVFAPPPTRLIEYGAAYSRIMFPYIVGLTLAALMMGACHTIGSFGPPSIGSVMLNLSIIAVGSAAIALGTTSVETTYWLSYAVIAGAVLRVAIMVPVLHRAGWRWRPDFDALDPELLRLLKMMSLAVLAMTISQVNIIVAGFFALLMGDGIKTFITYANRLIGFPMALTATAVATAMLPQLSRYLLEKRHAELADMMAFTKRLEIVLMTPAMLGLVVFGLPIMELIFQHGQWTAADSAGAYWALLFYAPGLLPMGWSRLLIQLSYARQDVMTPLKAASLSMFVNVILNAVFAFGTDLRQGGLALAATISTALNYALLAWYMRADVRARGTEPARIVETLWKSLVAGAIACALGWAVYHGLGRVVPFPANMLGRAAHLLPVIAGVAALYFVGTHLLRAPDSDRATAMLLRRFRREGPKKRE